MLWRRWQPHGHFESLFVGRFVRFHHQAEAGGVDANRFFQEDVLARRDGRRIVRRPEAGRGAEKDHVGTGPDHLLEGVEPDENAIGGNVDLPDGAVFDHSSVFPQPLQRGRRRLLESVAQGDQAHVLAGGQAVDDGAGAAGAAADQGDLQLVAARGVGRPRDVQPAGQGDPRRRGRRALEEFSTRWFHAVTHGVLLKG